jgi:hypothetical protein
MEIATEMIEAKTFRTFIRVYSLFKNERSRANIKLTLHKALIRSGMMTYACNFWELAADTYLLKLQRGKERKKERKKDSPHHWKLAKVHIGPRFPHGFQTSVCIRYIRNCAGKNRSHKNSREWIFS